MTTTDLTWGIGRRKESVARVRVLPGKGEVTVNGKAADLYFRTDRDRHTIRQPLIAAGSGTKYDIHARVDGGGASGQAGAILLGIARALVKLEPELGPKLRTQGFLTRDARKVERKKYGHKKARRSFQYSKR